jgi:8-oxo-dGTP pyrophosphatase MutT (NUDIX family)
MERTAEAYDDVPAATPEVVKVFVENDRDQVLLVDERGKPKESLGTPSRTTEYDKRPGRGFPGGKVEGTVEDMERAIRRLLRRQGIGMEHMRSVGAGLKRFSGFPHVYLTAVKEALEETGMLVIPRDIELFERSAREVVWLVFAREVTNGTRQRLDPQIRGVGWYPTRQLPQGMYARAKRMVRRAQQRQRGASYDR